MSNTPNSFSSNDDNYDWRSTKKQRDMIYDTAGKMSKKEASLWFRIGRTIIESRPSEQQPKPEQTKLEGNGSNGS